MSFAPSIGYQLEQAKARGDNDQFYYLANTSWQDIVDALLGDGYTPDQLHEELDNAIANHEPEDE